MKLSLLVNKIQSDFFESKQTWKNGASVCINMKIQEGDKQRIQSYSGTIISQHNAGFDSTITVQRISKGVEIIRTFPLYCPDIQSIQPIIINSKKKKR